LLCDTKPKFVTAYPLATAWLIHCHKTYTDFIKTNTTVFFLADRQTRRNLVICIGQCAKSSTIIKTRNMLQAYTDKHRRRSRLRGSVAGL